MSTLQNKLNKFFDVILKGESKTYNDHNYYTWDGLKGHVEGSWGTPYRALDGKKISQLTIGDVKALQSRSRDSVGQLWATGRYQIIPDTLKGLQNSLKLSDNVLYDQKTQDAMGYRLLTERKDIRNYIEKKVDDTQENLEKAALQVAMIWSSVGVPFDTQGRHARIVKNQSYYSGGGDKASVKTEDAQRALKDFRNDTFSKRQEEKKNDGKKRKPVFSIMVGLGVVGLAIGLYKIIKG